MLSGPPSSLNSRCGPSGAALAPSTRRTGLRLTSGSSPASRISGWTCSRSTSGRSLEAAVSGRSGAPPGAGVLAFPAGGVVGAGGAARALVDLWQRLGVGPYFFLEQPHVVLGPRSPVDARERVGLPDEAGGARAARDPRCDAMPDR